MQLARSYRASVVIDCWWLHEIEELDTAFLFVIAFLSPSAANDPRSDAEEDKEDSFDESQ